MDRLTDPDKPELKIEDCGLNIKSVINGICDFLKPSFSYNMLAEKMNLAPKPFQPTHRM
jgi:hypothetical protein